jgi:Holliday junction resolvase-like predicted endonuclease
MQYVTPRKLEKMRQTALLYLAQNNLDCPARMDVIEILAPDDLREGPREINHIENAYTEIKP